MVDSGGKGCAPRNRHLEPVDFIREDFGSLYDELPLWSASFGMLMLERIPMRPYQMVLDVGAGTGFLAIELAQRCGRQTKVIAVDPWKAAIRRLRWKTEQLGLTNIEILEQDAATLAVPDSSVDLIVSNLGINNFDNAEAVLATCFRIAKPGANLFLTTNLVGHMQEFYDVYRSTLIQLDMTHRLHALEADILHRASMHGVRSLLDAAGFRVGDVTLGQFQMRFASGAALLQHHFIRLGFLEGWRAVVGDDEIETVFVALERNLDELAATAGDITLTIPMACVEATRSPV
jgi:arsenite methyltransferase